MLCGWAVHCQTVQRPSWSEECQDSLDSLPRTRCEKFMIWHSWLTRLARAVYWCALIGAPCAHSGTPTFYRVHSSFERIASDTHNRSTIRKMSYYHGLISSRRANSLLNPRNDGSFLIRDSQSQPGCFVLSAK